MRNKVLAFKPRKGIYEDSNVTFDPKTCQAQSYGWWTFVKRIGGQVVFNDYKYSETTSAHQRKLRLTLEALGIQIDRTVSQRQSL